MNISIFLFFLNTADPSCGGNFTESEGVITSPFWPNPYINSQQCIYIIQQPEDEKVFLNFTHIELESHSDCSANYIEVTPLISWYESLIACVYKSMYNFCPKGHYRNRC